MTDKDREYWRNKGEQDRARHRDYQRPHGILRALITWTVAGMKKTREDNEAYFSGWNNARNRG
jgi:hypothetical protein